MKPIIGKRFGKLVVVELSDKKNGQNRYKCDCDCGNKSIAFASNLRRGHTTSCGCVGRTAAVTHGQYKNPAFRCWSAMKDRCLNPKHEAWSRYGGAGITISKEWLNDPNKFFDHIGPRPSPIHTVDRIDPLGNYESGNVRWETPTQQMANARSCVNITVNGVTKNLRQWGIAIGVSRAAIKMRAKSDGISIEESVVYYARKRGFFPLSQPITEEKAA